MPMAGHIKGLNISKMNDLEEFKRFTLSAIEDEKRSIHDSFMRQTKGLDEKDVENYKDLYGEEYFMVEGFFSATSLNAFVVILYSYIESGLNSLCNAMYSDQRNKCKKEGGQPLQIKYKDISGTGIIRAKRYLEKVFDVDLYAGEQPWAEINALRKIRNDIVHNEGWASENTDKDACIQGCVSKDRIKIERSRNGSPRKLILKPEYLDWILGHTQTFFSNINVRL